jgi:predicted ATP-binding protein involved in virulence
MRWQEEIRLQRLGNALAENRSLSDIESPHLQAVEEAVCRCISGATHFRYDVSHKELRISFADGRQLPISLLSGGYQNLVVIVADLAWRAVVLNPHLGREAPKQTAGVVLIDEIDLHLHPRWQRTVIENLRAAFPRLQFIATTHSPQVLSSARGRWVRLLSPEGRALRVDHVEGRDSNALLEDIFGTDSRPVATKEKLEALFELIDRGDHVAARAAVEELEPSLGSHDADLVRAHWLLDH